MTVFDVEQVRQIAADINSQLDRCESDKTHCQTIDQSLTCCADICYKFIGIVQKWGQDVFAGRVAFNPNAESLLKAELAQAYSRAVKAWEVGRKAEIPCYDLPGQCRLESALWNLGRLIDGWVTPRISVGPSARRELYSDSSFYEEARKRIASLPILPIGWETKGLRQDAPTQRG